MTYELPISSIVGGSTELSALFMPSNLTQFSIAISSEIASSRPEYGYEFIFECFHALSRSVNSQSQKIALLRCIAPWIPYLGFYLEYAMESSDDDATTALKISHDQSISNLKIDEVHNDSPEPHQTPVKTSSATSTFGSRSVSFLGSVSTSRRNSTLQRRSDRQQPVSSPSSDYSHQAVHVSPTESSMHRSVELKYDFLGYRISNASSDDIINDIENVFEIALCCGSADNALASELNFQFWDNIALLNDVSGLALKYFIKRLSKEALQCCLSPTTTKSEVPAKKSDADVSASNAGILLRKCSNDDRKSEILCLQEDDVLFDAYTSNNLRSVQQAVSFGAGSRMAVHDVKKKSFFDIQGNCGYCMTICEAIATLGSKSADNYQQFQSVTLIKLLVGHINDLLEEILKEGYINESRKTENQGKAENDIHIDINDSYIKVPPHGISFSEPSRNTFSHVITSSKEDIYLHSRLTTGGPDSINVTPIRKRRTEQSQMKNKEFFDDSDVSEGDRGNSDDVAESTTGDSLRRNLETFFSMPVPKSPAHLSSKPKKRPPESLTTPKVPEEGKQQADCDKKFNCKWVVVNSLIRPLLHLLFDNGVVVEQCTPELLHLCLNLLAEGPRSLRPAVYTVLSSLVYVLQTETSDEQADEQDSDAKLVDSIDTFKLSSEEMDDDQQGYSGYNQFRKGFLIQSGGTVSSWKDITELLNADEVHTIFNKALNLTFNNFEIIVRILFHIVQVPRPELAERWKELLWNKSLQSCMKEVPIRVEVRISGVTRLRDVDVMSPLFPSNFYLLAYLVNEDRVSTTYIVRLLSTFRDIMNICGEYDFVSSDNEYHIYLNEVEDKILRPVCFCLRNSLNFIDVIQLQRLFWSSVLLLQYFPDHYLSGPLSLLDGIVGELLSHNVVQESVSVDGDEEGKLSKDSSQGNKVLVRNLGSILLDKRYNDSGLSKIFDDLESSNLLGVSFDSSFSTSLTLTLLRIFNVKDSKTKKVVINLLQKLLQNDQVAYAEQCFESAIVGQPSTWRNVEGKSQNLGTDEGVSGYCPILLPHLGLDETTVSRPLPREGGYPGSNEQLELETMSSTEFSSISRQPRNFLTLKKKKSMNNMSNSSRLSAVPTYLSSVCHSSKSQFVAPTFFGCHNFPNEKSIVLFVASLLAYLRLLSQSDYSDEEQQSHSFAVVILLEVLRELPLALQKLYGVVFSELNDAYKLSLRRNQHLANVVLEAIHECLLSNPRLSNQFDGTNLPKKVDVSNPYVERDSDSCNTDELFVERKNIIPVHKPADSDSGIVAKIKSSILERDKKKDSFSEKTVNIMRDDVDFVLDNMEGSPDGSPDGSSQTGTGERREHLGMAYLAELGFPAILCGPYAYNFKRCVSCQQLSWSIASTCPCFNQRYVKKEKVSCKKC